MNDYNIKAITVFRTMIFIYNQNFSLFMLFLINDIRCYGNSFLYRFFKKSIFGSASMINIKWRLHLWIVVTLHQRRPVIRHETIS